MSGVRNTWYKQVRYESSGSRVLKAGDFISAVDKLTVHPTCVDNFTKF